MNHQPKTPSAKIKIRKHLNADALFQKVHDDFECVPDTRKGEIKIEIADALMSGFAMFSLKDPSLLAFDERRATDANLNSIYKIDNVPCDTQLRTILDPVEPKDLRAAFKNPFRQLQRSNLLEKMKFYDGCYLLTCVRQW